MPEVAQYKIGNTTIRIFDDACADKSQAEVEEILRRISRLAIRVHPKPTETVSAPVMKPSSQRP
jgi:GTPase